MIVRGVVTVQDNAGTFLDSLYVQLVNIVQAPMTGRDCQLQQASNLLTVYVNKVFLTSHLWYRMREVSPQYTLFTPFTPYVLSWHMLGFSSCNIFTP